MAWPAPLLCVVGDLTWGTYLKVQGVVTQRRIFVGWSMITIQG